MQLNNKLANGRVELVVNSDNSLGYKLDGADTVHPFSKSMVLSCNSQFGWNSDVLLDTKCFNTLILQNVKVDKQQNNNYGLAIRGKKESGEWEYFFGNYETNIGTYVYNETFDITQYSAVDITVTGGYVLTGSQFIFNWQ